MESIKNFNDGARCYQQVAHTAGIHLKKINKIDQREIEDRIQKIEEAKTQLHQPKQLRKMNRLKNYLMEAKEELEQ